MNSQSLRKRRSSGTAEQKVAAHNNRFDLTRPLSSFLLTFPYLILEKAPETKLQK